MKFGMNFGMSIDTGWAQKITHIKSMKFKFLLVTYDFLTTTTCKFHQFYVVVPIPPIQLLLRNIKD